MVVLASPFDANLPQEVLRGNFMQNSASTMPAVQEISQGQGANMLKFFISSPLVFDEEKFPTCQLPEPLQGFILDHFGSGVSGYTLLAGVNLELICPLK